MRLKIWSVGTVILVALTMGAFASDEIPQEVLERYWECQERHDLDAISDLLWVHHDVERIDASVYGLPADDFDDRSLLTIQERLDFRAAKAAAGEEPATATSWPTPASTPARWSPSVPAGPATSTSPRTTPTPVARSTCPSTRTTLPT